MSLIDSYSASKISQTSALAYNNVVSTVNIFSLSVSGGLQIPILFVLRSTSNVYLRQSRTQQAATSTDFLLLANTYWPLLIENQNDGYLSLLRETTNGTLFLTLVNQIFE